MRIVNSFPHASDYRWHPYSYHNKLCGTVFFRKDTTLFDVFLYEISMKDFVVVSDGKDILMNNLNIHLPERITYWSEEMFSRKKQITLKKMESQLSSSIKKKVKQSAYNKWWFTRKNTILRNNCSFTFVRLGDNTSSSWVNTRSTGAEGAWIENIRMTNFF